MDASDVYAEVERVAVGMLRAVGPRHGERLREQAAHLGIESPGLIGDLSAHLLAGDTQASLITRRFRYRMNIEGDLQRWIDAGALSRHDGRVHATERLLPFLTEAQAARDETAEAAWEQYPQQAAAIAGYVATVVDGVAAEHPLATANHALPRPATSSACLLHDLITMRYVRADDHAAAWSEAGLDAGTIVPLTALWNRGEVEDERRLADLVDARLAVAGPPAALTDHGRELRSAIEDSTEARYAASLDSLGPVALDGFVSALRALPATP